MTLNDIITQVDKLKPNAFDKETKTQWINEVEGEIVEQILNKAQGDTTELRNYNYDMDSETTLLVPDRFCDIYTDYLAAKIDFNNAEFGRFNNSTAMYNSAFEAFSKYYRRNHTPKQNHSFNPIGGEALGGSWGGPIDIEDPAIVNAKEYLNGKLNTVTKEFKIYVDENTEALTQEDIDSLT